jgi:NAD(P)-dependent dehydrogenase (short-subunit alcohol dehydrogenase family)
MNRVVVITGGSRGIGAATARLAAQQGPIREFGSRRCSKLARECD